MLRELFLSAACCVGLLPLTVHAAATARQEYRDAVRAKPNYDRGAEAFRDCAVCHGTSGNGDEAGDVPRIAGQHFTVLVRQLVDYRHDTRWDIRMEHFASQHVLGDAQAVANVAAYVSQLTPEGPRNVGTGEQVPHGAEVYAARCENCHGPVGEGNATEVVPRLAGQHYEYLLRQMYDAVDGRRPNFSRDHVRMLAKLERADLVGVADFLARSEWTGPKELPGALH